MTGTGTRNTAPTCTYPFSAALAGIAVWDRVTAACNLTDHPDTLAKNIMALAPDLVFPDYLPDLIRLEGHMAEAAQSETQCLAPSNAYALNPTLAILQLSWHLASYYFSPDVSPQPGEEIVLIWKDPASRQLQMKAASHEELLALKIIAEEIPFLEASDQGQITPGTINNILNTAISQGLILKPVSRIQRESHSARDGKPVVETQTADAFTLQWHITQVCDLHCKHCYDRSSRSPLTPDQAGRLMTDFYNFCHQRFVDGHICFSGGNPFLYPHFFDLYQRAVDMGFGVSILGNPVSRETLERLVEIEPAGFFQVSLEGLEAHNDYIRGKGYFKRVLDFLDILRDFPLQSAVMLTLTRDNIDQVLPLKEVLKGRVDSFDFNRLACFGEGANLQLPDPETYQEFLKAYVAEAETDDLLAFKDNLINIELARRGWPLSDGCTGFGCGAAFNFMAVLPDGETHACRKFPSIIGNIIKQGIAEVYDSPVAKKYRQGSSACSGCSLKPLCGGCMAVTAGAGKDCFTERDPMCFFPEAP